MDNVEWARQGERPYSADDMSFFLDTKEIVESITREREVAKEINARQLLDEGTKNLYK